MRARANARARLVRVALGAELGLERVPRAHQSAPRPCPLLEMISGARYSGVPHSVKVRSRTTLAKPKSTSFR